MKNRNMGFKLKHKNVESTGLKASPFKINQALVMGAGDAAKSFTDIRSGFQSGNKTTIAPVGDDDTVNAINNTIIDPCEGKEGEELKKCKQMVADQEALNNVKLGPDDKKEENIEDIENNEDEPVMMSRQEYKESVGDDFKSGDYTKYKRDFKSKQQSNT
mgnify:FL=1